MPIAKIIEISSSSPESFEDAIRNGVERASSTIDGIRNVWIKEQQAIVENGRVSEFRVNMKVTFLLNSK